MFEGLGDPDKNCSRAATVMINCLLKERGNVLLEKVRGRGLSIGVGGGCGWVGGGAGGPLPALGLPQPWLLSPCPARLISTGFSLPVEDR